MTNKVEITTRNKGVPGVNVTITLLSGKSIYRAVVPANAGEIGNAKEGWLVVDSYTLDSVSVKVPTMEAGIEYVKGLAKQ